MAAVALTPPSYSETVRLAAPVVPGWDSMQATATGWRPSFKGAAGQVEASYRSETDDAVVDLYHAVYTGRPRQGHSLITFGNDVYDPARARVLSESRLRVDLAEGRSIPAGELRMAGPAGSRLAWYWYCVDARCTQSPVWTKLLQAWDVLRGHVPRSSVWALSSAIADGNASRARARIRAFARSISLSDDSDPYPRDLVGNARKGP